MMKKRGKSRRTVETTEDLLKKLLIVQLRVAGVSQDEIARIVGKSLSDVAAIAKYVKVAKK